MLIAETRVEPNKSHYTTQGSVLPPPAPVHTQIDAAPNWATASLFTVETQTEVHTGSSTTERLQLFIFNRLQKMSKNTFSLCHCR